MKIEHQKWITRQDLRRNPDKIYLFGDNVARKGYGGQAKEMRGEPNAIGIPTKWTPSNVGSAFFDDKYFTAQCRHIDKAFAQIPPNSVVVIPSDGLGTGLAQLDTKAPKTFAYLQMKLKTLEGEG